VARFLKAKEEHLTEMDIASFGLVPNTNKGRKGQFYSANTFNVVMSEVEKISGIKSRIKDFPSTYAQMNIDRGPNFLPDVSKFLVHATTKTTEEHYGRIKDRTAFLRVERAWGVTHVLNQTQSALLEFRTEIWVTRKWTGGDNSPNY
jgi:integrase